MCWSLAVLDPADPSLERLLLSAGHAWAPHQHHLYGLSALYQANYAYALHSAAAAAAAVAAGAVAAAAAAEDGRRAALGGGLVPSAGGHGRGHAAAGIVSQAAAAMRQAKGAASAVTAGRAAAAALQAQGPALPQQQHPTAATGPFAPPAVMAYAQRQQELQDAHAASAVRAGDDPSAVGDADGTSGNRTAWPRDFVDGGGAVGSSAEPAMFGPLATYPKLFLACRNAWYCNILETQVRWRRDARGRWGA